MTVKVAVTGCPPGSIKLTDTINGGSQTITGNRAPATVVSQGNPGTYRVTATCANGAFALSTFVVTKEKKPTVKLTPASTGPTTETIDVAVAGCPPGSIHITDTINDGSQTIKHNNAPATIVSQGTPGTYRVTAKCSDGATGHATFSVRKGDGPTVKLDPSTSGPVTKTINVAVNGCPPGSIRITDTINDGSQRIKHNGAPATVVSEGTPGTYTVTAKCSDGATGHATFVVTPGGVVQTGGGATSAGIEDRWVALGVGLLLLAGAAGLALYRSRRRIDAR